MPKVAFAYSGGLDTSVLLKRLQEHYGYDVIAVSIDLGEEDDYEAIRQKALNCNAIKAFVIDAKERFAKEYAFQALKANAMYEGKYPLSTALARPLIAQIVGEVAVAEGADAVAHGATGKGNDQVRFEVTWACLFPKLKRLAPMRDWGVSREAEIEYAQQHGIPVPVGKESPYSYDTNLWGKSCECGPLEDPWTEPPDNVHEWTVDPEKAPDQPGYVEIGFEQGQPISLDGKPLAPADLIAQLNDFAGKHGVGRIDMVENRLVGIKSRETYECPAATVLLAAHRDLEALVLERDLAHYKAMLELKYGELIYNGLWFSPLRLALDRFLDATQETVTGTVRMKLHKGNCIPVGRKSPFSLYRYELATYDETDRYDQTLAKGFIDIWAMSPQIAEAARQKAEGKGQKR